MIKKLPKDVSLRIAAGEVIERPVSIAKELIENSIDADASAITLYLEAGGKSSLIIEDNGHGIDFNELPLAVERYATSKIAKIEDLEQIATLGYRGEALASIATVSKIEIRSRTVNSDIESGGMIRCEPNKIILHTHLPGPVGTRIQVNDLFFNLPARRKFLKTGSAETRRIVKVVNDYALIHPEIAFKVISDGRKIIDYESLKTIDDAINRNWGCETEKYYAEDHNENGQARVWWNPLPDSRRVQISLFVNGRRIQDSTVRAAICSGEGMAYGEWIVLLNLPSNDLDVNIHPTKEEVRFRKTQVVFRLVYHCAKNVFAQRLSIKNDTVIPKTLSGESVILHQAPQVFVNNEQMDAQRNMNLFETVRPTHDTNTYSYPESSCTKTENSFLHDLTSNADWASVGKAVCSNNIRVAELSSVTEETPSRIYNDYDVRYIGQTGRGFLLFDLPDSLAIVDPHAAHERILYEEIRNNFKGAVLVQELTVPLEIPAMVKPSVITNSEILKKLGFIVKSDMLVGVPNIKGKGHLNPVEMLRSALKGLEVEHDETKVDREVWWRIARLACRNAVKLGWNMEKDEAVFLMERLNQCEFPYTCPHGRPTIYLVNNKKLEEWFER